MAVRGARWVRSWRRRASSCMEGGGPARGKTGAQVGGRWRASPSQDGRTGVRGVAGLRAGRRANWSAGGGGRAFRCAKGGGGLVAAAANGRAAGGGPGRASKGWRAARRPAQMCVCVCVKARRSVQAFPTSVADDHRRIADRRGAGPGSTPHGVVTSGLQCVARVRRSRADIAVCGSCGVASCESGRGHKVKPRNVETWRIGGISLYAHIDACTQVLARSWALVHGLLGAGAVAGAGPRPKSPQEACRDRGLVGRRVGEGEGCPPHPAPSAQAMGHGLILAQGHSPGDFGERTNMVQTLRAHTPATHSEQVGLALGAHTLGTPSGNAL